MIHSLIVPKWPIWPPDWLILRVSHCARHFFLNLYGLIYRTFLRAKQNVLQVHFRVGGRMQSALHIGARARVPYVFYLLNISLDRVGRTFRAGTAIVNFRPSTPSQIHDLGPK
jgi:hypothetical protein